MAQTTTHTAADHRAPGEEPAALGISGAALSEDETAAVVAVLARLASAEPDSSDAGGTGPADRTLQRRHRLQLKQHGLWGRPGPDSWQMAGGLR